jgi:ABC-type dipeptide/oligopeptide/nickel transport system permease component
MGRSPTDLGVFIGKRLLYLIPVILGVMMITFFFTHVATRNPCAVWAGRNATDVQINLCIRNFGLDQPLPNQFVRYMGNLLTGDWGVDPRGGTSILPAIASAFPATLELVLTSLFLIVVIGIPLGVIAASHNGRWPDHLVRIFYLSGWATPTYLGAILLAIIIGPVFGLPTSGEYLGSPTFPRPTHMSVLDAILAGDLGATGDAIAHLILPAVALAFLNMGIATRMTRASMLEVLPLDFVKTARMKGLSEFWVLYKHALRNSLISTTTVLGVTAGGLLSGTVVIEEVFQWPGIGRYAFDAVTNYNFPGAIAVVIVFACGVVVSNMIADILYGILDPRVEWR